MCMCNNALSNSQNLISSFGPSQKQFRSSFISSFDFPN